MRAKLFKTGGFSLSEVMVSAAILVLVTAGFATVGIMMRSMSNVKTRNIAYAVANDRMNELQSNPSLMPDFIQDDIIDANAETADGTYVVDSIINDREVGTKDGTPVYQTFTRREIFYPVKSERDTQTGDTNMVNLVNTDNTIRAEAVQSNLVRVIVRVTWQDYRKQRTYRIEEEDYIRKAD